MQNWMLFDGILSGWINFVLKKLDGSHQVFSYAVSQSNLIQAKSLNIKPNI